MSDLISRSDVLELLYEIFNRYNITTDKITKLHCFGTDVCKEIRNMPTAYDIDKVVEELEQKKEEVQRMRKTCVALSDLEVCDIENVTYERAIEIVKQCGASDNVCEWKQTSTAKYKTSCGYKLEEYFDTNACYCKQCGKKIKVVE